MSEELPIIVGLGIVCGFITGMVIGVCGGLPVVGGSILLWLLSLRAPVSVPMYRYVAPVALPLVGMLILGMVGYGIGCLVAIILQVIADDRRFSYSEPLARTSALGLALACAVFALLVWALLGTGWRDLGSGALSRLAASRPAVGPLFGFGAIGATLGLMQQIGQYLLCSLDG